MSIAPLVTFRILFGLLMFFSIARFWWRGWITAVYVQPRMHFSYLGFEWVQYPGSIGIYLLFTVLLVSTLLITVGLFYRLAAVAFFLAFTWVELIDVTTYLNHYYFISLVAFLLIWLPANRSYSLDIAFKRVQSVSTVPAWTINIIRFQLAVVYVFAGLAKLNYDWLIEAQPMRTWLPGKTHLPIVGAFMYKTWVAYLFSWFGAAYDLFIVFFLINRRTRPIAYGFVLLFHIATAIFFPGIGMFPYVMIVSSLVFFDGDFHDRLLSLLPFYNVKEQYKEDNEKQLVSPSGLHPVLSTALILYIFIQLLVPLRFLLYPGHLFWHEEGYRFSWRVMLMEKSGAAYFTVKDSSAHQQIVVNNAEFLTPLQEKMMSTQPDMIVKYARYLSGEYQKRGLPHPQVFGEVYVSLNGDRSRLFIDSTINLAQQSIGWDHYAWVLPWSLTKP